MISGIILSIFCGFLVFTIMLMTMGDEPLFNYNFKAVPIINEEFVERGLRDEMCDYLALDDAKQLFVLLGKYITAVEMRI